MERSNTPVSTLTSFTKSKYSSMPVEVSMRSSRVTNLPRWLQAFAFVIKILIKITEEKQGCALTRFNSACSPRLDL